MSKETVIGWLRLVPGRLPSTGNEEQGEAPSALPGSSRWTGLACQGGCGRPRGVVVREHQEVPAEGDE